MQTKTRLYIDVSFAFVCCCNNQFQTQYREDGMSKKKKFISPLTPSHIIQNVSKYLTRLPIPATATEIHWDTP